MELEVGSILEGRVTGITNFGAFVTFPTGKSGLVHISEIAYPYVQNVKDHLQEGQTVKVKVIGIDATGRINLSIKRLTEPVPPPPGRFPPRDARPPRPEGHFGGPRPDGRPPRPDNRPAGGRPGGFQQGARSAQPPRDSRFSAPPAPQPPASADTLFEDKLKRFMQDSDSKISGVRQYERRVNGRKGKGKIGGDDF